MIGGMGTYLPEPTGPSPVGSTSVHLTDASRPDPWAAGVNARELMVSLWYPAVPSDGPRARYMTPAESELQLTSRGITGVPPDALSTVRTNAAADAGPAGCAPVSSSSTKPTSAARPATTFSQNPRPRGPSRARQVVTRPSGKAVPKLSYV